jgi:hypothetical protein
MSMASGASARSGAVSSSEKTRSLAAIVAWKVL